MTTPVEFTEYIPGSEKRVQKARAKGHVETYLIDPRKVSVVIPRKRYTTLVVDGTYWHVTQLHQVVCQRIGWGTPS